MMQKKFIVFPRLRSSWAGAWLSDKVLAWPWVQPPRIEEEK